MAWIPVFALLFAIVTASSTVGAQNRQPQTPQVKQATASTEPAGALSVLVDSTDDYRIGPRDVLEIKVDDADELSKVYEIRADGTFLMSYLNRIKAQGRTPDELARFIENGLRGSYLKDPHVSVVVKAFNSHTFYVQGSIHRPGPYQIEGKPSLFKLIIVAGGLMENCGTTAFVIRRIKDKASDSSSEGVAGQDEKSEADVSEYEVHQVSIAGLQRGRVPQFILEPGDLVNIPKADLFYVAGEVNAPGSFPLSDGTTLRQAIALSQGMTFNAKSNDARIMRTDEKGKLQELKVDISAIMKNKAEDVPLMANDLIIVPNSRGKSIANTMLKAFGMGAAQRGIYRY
jgi:polysaccharide export outer membrane protein